MIPTAPDRFPDAAVAARNLCRQVVTQDGTLTLLDSINLDLKRGETLAISGASGSGKSTLLGLLAGLDQASSGEVWLLGTPLAQLDEDARARLRKSRIGFVFQSFQLLPSLSALDNVALPLDLAGRRDAHTIARHWLAEVGLAARERHTPRQLSGGEQQRVALARAFATDPELVFADEPTGNLDAATGEVIADLLFDLNARSATTLVLVTHDVDLAVRCSQRLQLVGGRISPPSALP